MRDCFKEKYYSEDTRKLHLRCPHRTRTGITTHVVIRDGYCYRSEQCMVIWCKFNRLQADIESIISVTW